MYSQNSTDPSVNTPSNFVDYFDNLKSYDLDYDLVKEASTLSNDIIDQCIESDDDDFLRANLPEITKPQYDVQNNESRQDSIYQDHLFSSYQNSENLNNGDPDLSLNGQFSNSCSLYSAGDPLRSANYFDGTNSYSSDVRDPYMLSNQFNSKEVYISNDMNSNSPLTFGAEASNHYDISYESPETSTCSFDSSTLEVSSASSGDVTRRPRKTLADLTDQEKYLRIREQNNLASREYRNRKKSKKTLTETELEQVIKDNETLKQTSKKLQTYYNRCLKSKEYLEKLGYNFSNLNLS